MLRFIPRLAEFWQDDEGQHLVEYAILLSWVALASIALFSSGGKSVKGVWSTANNQLVQANMGAS